MISILICTHDRSGLLAKTLDSLERLDPCGGIDREVVVVDNASGDRTREVVAEFAAASGHPVRYRYEGTLGKSHALNAGIGHCSGDVVAFTDDDAIVEPDWLERIAATLGEYDAGIVFGKVVPLWESGPPSWYSPRHGGRFALLDYGPEPRVVDDKDHAFHGVNLAIRREVLEGLGGFRTDKGPCGRTGGAGEDTDLFERAVDAGVAIVYDPRVLVRHFIPAARCAKTFHREALKKGRGQYYHFVREREKDLPQFLGLPRYRYRLAAASLSGYVTNAIRGEEPDRFHHELQLRRFFWLFVQSRRGDVLGEPTLKLT